MALNVSALCTNYSDTLNTLDIIIPTVNGTVYSTNYTAWSIRINTTYQDCYLGAMIDYGIAENGFWDNQISDVGSVNTTYNFNFTNVPNGAYTFFASISFPNSTQDYTFNRYKTFNVNYVPIGNNYIIHISNMSGGAGEGSFRMDFTPNETHYLSRIYTNDGYCVNYLSGGCTNQTAFVNLRLKDLTTDTFVVASQTYYCFYGGNPANFQIDIPNDTLIYKNHVYRFDSISGNIGGCTQYSRRYSNPPTDSWNTSNTASGLRGMTATYYGRDFINLTGLYNGLVAYYNMDESNGSNVANSVVGGVNGTTAGTVSIISGKLGNARNQTRTNGNKINLDANICNFGTGNFSFNAWYKNGYDTPYSNNEALIGNERVVPLYDGLLVLQNYNGNIVPSSWDFAGIPFSGSNYMFESRTNVSGRNTTDWTMITAVRTNLNISIYINGILQPLIIVSGRVNYTANISNNIICTLMNGGDVEYPFGGAIDEVGLWNRSLTTTEINKLYNNNNGITYPFPCTNFSTNMINISIPAFNSTIYGDTIPVTVDLNTIGQDCYASFDLVYGLVGYENVSVNNISIMGVSSYSHNFTNHSVGVYHVFAGIYFPPAEDLYNVSDSNTNITFGCIDTWIQTNSSCNGYNFTILYTDINNCNTTTNLPVDNGTIITCEIYSCYQESFNVSNQTGIDGGCNLFYTGTSFHNTSASDKWVYFNYSKPLQVTNNSLLYASLGTNNSKTNGSNYYPNIDYFSIPSSCWYANHYKLQLAVYSSGSGFSDSLIYCFNNSDWVQIVFYRTSSPSSATAFGNYFPSDIFDGNWLTGAGHRLNYGKTSVPFNDYDRSKASIFEEAMIWSINSSICIESWIQSNSSCNGENYTVSYNDLNNCNVSFYLPSDNGSIIPCCNEFWSAVYEPPECLNGSQEKYYIDLSGCGTNISLPVDNGTIISCLTVQDIVDNTNNALVNMIVIFLIIGVLMALTTIFLSYIGLESDLMLKVVGISLVAIALIILVLCFSLFNIL